MPLTLTATPASEPVSLSDAKTWLRVGHGEEDPLITSLIASARQRVEQWTGLALITQSWAERLDGWPAHRLSPCGQAISLPIRPLISVEAVRTLDAEGIAEVWDPAEYRVEPGEPGRIIATMPFSLPQPGRSLGGIEIEFTAGFGASGEAVPDPLREAILRLVASAYATVEPAESAQRGAASRDPAIQSLLQPWWRTRL